MNFGQQRKDRMEIEYSEAYDGVKFFFPNEKEPFPNQAKERDKGKINQDPWLVRARKQAQNIEK